MNIHFRSPFRLDKRLGKAYNDCFKDVGDDDWIVFTDYDVLFLTPETIPNIYKYIEKNIDAGILTCYTNRIGKASSKKQCYKKIISDNNSISHHIKIARKFESNLYKATRIQYPISGFLMCVSKKTWNNIKFSEKRLALGVDTDFSHKVNASGLEILRMDGIYVWHTYRLEHGIGFKNHLK